MQRIILTVCFFAIGAALPESGFAAERLSFFERIRLHSIDSDMARRTYTTVHFDFDRDALDAEARQRIARQAAYIKARNDVRFAVTGHTDKVGNAAYNMELGMRRARRVLNELVRLGVPKSRLVAVVSMGEKTPVVKTEDRERLNRRVTTRVLIPEDSEARTVVSRNDPAPERQRSFTPPPGDPDRIARSDPTPEPSSTSRSDPAPTVESAAPSPSPAPMPSTSVSTSEPAPVPTTASTADPAPTPVSGPTPEPTPEPEPTVTTTSDPKPRPGNSAEGTGRPDAGKGNGNEPSGDPAGSVGHNKGGDE